MVALSGVCTKAMSRIRIARAWAYAPFKFSSLLSVPGVLHAAKSAAGGYAENRGLVQLAPCR